MRRRACLLAVVATLLIGLPGCVLPGWSLLGGLGFVAGRITGSGFAIVETTTRCIQNGEPVPCPNTDRERGLIFAP
jgi:hypothetical protein